MLTVFFVILQLHPVMDLLNRMFGSLFGRPNEIANEYGCPSAKGTLWMALVFFILALFWMKPLV
jgi:hypothetical protein